MVCVSWNRIYELVQIEICLRLPNIYHHHHFLNTHTLSHSNVTRISWQYVTNQARIIVTGIWLSLVKMKRHLNGVRFWGNETFVHLIFEEICEIDKNQMQIPQKPLHPTGRIREFIICVIWNKPSGAMTHYNDQQNITCINKRCLWPLVGGGSVSAKRSPF